MKPGAGTATERLPGFEAGGGAALDLRKLHPALGGRRPNLDGPTKALFDGGDIPHI
ncbi:MAG: hypothetical protein IPI67_07770 [Myxococcales bacterium]|nr:hypothetical protein [Myxococcales bacterium]